MEFPELGTHCGWPDCKQLDFLPFTCELCSRIFCKNHRSFDEHQCPETYQKDVRVPTCPLCNAIVLVQRGEDPNIKVNEHIANQCRESGAAAPGSGTKSKQCHMRGCKKVDTVQVRCEKCGNQYCLKHRFEDDHKCQGRRTQLANAASRRVASAPKPAATSARPGQPRLTQKASDSSRPQQSMLNATGRQLEQERRNRQAAQAVGSARATQPVQSTSSQQPTSDVPHAQRMAEDEALARALQDSFQPGTQNSSAPPGSSRPAARASSNTGANEEDADLQRAIAASLQDQEQKKEESSCIMV